MLHYLSCCETRFRLLCCWYLLHSSLNLVFRQHKLHNIFIFGMAYWSFKYKVLSRVSPLQTNLIFLSPFGLLKFQNFLYFLFILKLSYLKAFRNNLNYVSTANIQKVMKFYNLGDKSFETDFSCRVLSALGKKFDSQPSSVLRLISLPTLCYYGLVENVYITLITNICN